jgi:hypothetical protein
MIKPTLITTTILIFLINISYCQTDSLNQQKYWVYKNRLKSKFMYIDYSNPYTNGSCIPASRRNYKEKRIEFGDATIYLANYLQVLATEYALLKAKNQPVDSTLHDLHLAIEAFVRLDRNAEYSFRGPGSVPSNEDINGFFIRDDVDSNYLKHNQSCFIDMDFNWTVSSDYIAHQKYNTNPATGSKYGIEMSKDQCWHLYLGFALISKLLDGVEIFDSNGNCYNFSERVRQITQMIQYQLSGADNDSHEWELYNPADGHEIPEARGGKVQLYSYGFGIAAKEIVGHYQHAHHSRSAWWRRAFLTTWKWEDWEADDFGARTLSTVGDVRGLNDFEHLVEESKRKNIYDYPQFPIIHLLLFPKLYGKKEWIIADSLSEKLKQPLDEAPMEGPGYCAPHYWTSVNCVVWPERRGKAIEGDEYNGLDYLLFYNLYCLTKIRATNQIIGPEPESANNINGITRDNLWFRRSLNQKQLVPFQINYISFPDIKAIKP